MNPDNQPHKAFFDGIADADKAMDRLLEELEKNPPTEAQRKKAEEEMDYFRDARTKYWAYISAKTRYESIGNANEPRL